MRLTKATVVLVLIFSLTWSFGPASASGADEGPVLFSLPVGSPIPYAGVGPEQFAWGPDGIAVDAGGDIWIGDGVNRVLREFSSTGSEKSAIALGKSFVGLGDVEVFAGSVLALDIAAPKPRVDIFGQVSGRLVQSIQLPESASLEKGLSGIAVLPDGTIVAELEGGSSLVHVGNLALGLGRQVAGQEQPEYITAAGSIDLLSSVAESSRNGYEAKLGGTTIEFPVANQPGTVLLVGSTTSAAYFAVDDVSQLSDGTILVDTTIRKFSSDGEFLESARVPRTEMIMNPIHSVAVAPNGEAYALVPKASTIDVVQLSFLPELAPILPTMQEIEPATEAKSATIQSCVSRTTMGNTDWAYRNNNHYYSATNISGSCSGRTKPRYLGSAGAYLSVSYEWGGFDTVATFNSQMSPGTGRAGNINSSVILSCSYGVDCSGFVSRVWQTTRHTTTTLPNISYAVSLSAMKDYDIFNKSGSHTMLYRYKSGSGYYVSESTTASSYDRVIYRWITSSYASGFTTRRYNNVCS